MSKGDGLGTAVNTVSIQTAKLSHDVRAALPKLAEASKRWSRATICPVCGDYKDATSKRCRTCFDRELRYYRKDHPVITPEYVTSGNYGGAVTPRNLGERRTGHTIDQPVRKRREWVDGGWVEVDW